ncbi:MAG: proteasome accessory factor PafA2 family protein [Armatimonadetes bacterium]|nr:proteasome accessory factor PafA2 family protein [Armatimonadota bacterium]
MHRLFGIETEYGIFVEGREASDLVAESMNVVRSYPRIHATAWDYKDEDPRRDMRGFRVDQLSSNPEDARFDRPEQAQLPRDQERSDRVLQNGARLYNDHGHPEYATPECRSLKQLAAHDRAGERIVLECARRRSSAGRIVSLYKNNTDYHGSSYGCHEGYLMKRDVPFDNIMAVALPFLVTRQIYAGAGKVGVEQKNSFDLDAPYQISQRADFFSVEASVDTLHNRPIVNTRDEPHATSRHYRRFHVIVGDANLSEYATAMKVGTTALMLSLVESGWTPPLRLKNPVLAIKQISRDQSLLWHVDLDDNRSIRAVDIQRLYREEAARRFRGEDDETDWALSEWERLLDALESDPMALADRLDWVAKRALLESFIASEGLSWEDPLIQSLDLEYSNVDPDQGLYHGLEQSGEMLRLLSDEDIEEAVAHPPADTRAFIRGESVRRFAASIAAIGWGKVIFKTEGHLTGLNLNPLVDGQVAALNRNLCAAEDIRQFAAMVKEGAKGDSP